MEKTQMTQERLKAAQLRTRAAHMDDQAAAYERQAANPIYDGQAGVCLGKASVVRAIADKQLAEADVIEAGG